MRLLLTKFIFLTVLLLLYTSVFGQDNANLTHYFMNPYSINPSFAGTDGKASLFLTYRKQWAGIEGGPVISNFSFHMPTGNKMGFGVNVSNADRGLLNTTSGYFTGSYAVSFSKTVKLRFGISAGAAYNGVNFEEIENIGDPALQELLLDNNIFVIANAGISLQAKTLNFGISIPNLFTDEYTSDQSFTVGEGAPFENALVFVSNRFYFGDHKHVFEPYLLYRYSDVLPPQFEASAAVHLNHVVWFGGAYKQNFGISAFGGVKVQKVFGMGYAYSLKNTGLNEINSPTHEIQLNLLLGVRKKDREYYSFVDTSIPKPKSKKLLALEKKREEEAKKREEAAKLKEEKARQAEEARKVEEAKKAEAALAAAAKEEEDRIEAEQKAIIAAAQKALEEEKKVAQQKLDQGKIKEVDKKEAEVVKKPEEDKNLLIHQATDETVVVKRGGHLLELSHGEYVVVGAFTDYEHAEAYSDELFFKGYKTKFGYISQQKNWYVYIFKGENAAEARKERDNYRKIVFFKNALVISVQ